VGSALTRITGTLIISHEMGPMKQRRTWTTLAIVSAVLAVTACNSDSPAPASSCELLDACCQHATGANRTTCDGTVSVGLDSTCLAALASYEATGVCEGVAGGAHADAGPEDAGHEDAGSTDSDPCGTLAPCCSAFPAGSQCSIAVGSKNATLCQQELESGDCKGSGGP
jgi:hypothetical protein